MDIYRDAGFLPGTKLLSEMLKNTILTDVLFL